MSDPTDVPATGRARTVLNAGSGPPSPRRLYGGFGGTAWREVTLDINAAVQPDHVGTVTDMNELFGAGTFDAVWSSHNMEHLHAHEVLPALREFRRVLKPSGFALITCPDLEEVARLLTTYGLDFRAYDSPAGPITVHDMLFGHGSSIASGDHFMTHNTGFTCERLGRLALDAGFALARVGNGDQLDLWAALLMPEADEAEIRACLREREAAILFS